MKQNLYKKLEIGNGSRIFVIDDNEIVESPSRALDVNPDPVHHHIRKKLPITRKNKFFARQTMDAGVEM